MGGVGSQVNESRAAIAEVFRNPGLRRINIALAGSIVGDWANGVGASVYAYTQGGATSVGVLGVVRFVSMALATPFAALLADRYNRKTVMIVSDLIRVVLVLTAAAVIEFDGPPMAVYTIAVLTAVASTAFRPAEAALMPKLASHPGELTAANAASSTIHSVGFFAGPALGGLILAVADIAAVYAFNAITFVWSAMLVFGLAIPVRDEDIQTSATGDADSARAAHADAAPAASAGAGPDQDRRPGVFDGVGAGFGEILRNRDLRLLIGLYCAQTMVAGASLVFGVAIALDLLDLGNSGVGMLDATVGIGGLVGGIVALVLAQRGKLARDFGLGVILWSAPLLIITVSPTLPAALVAMLLICLANSVVDVNAYTILQRLVPDEVLGRVFGAMDSAVIAGMAAGSLAMPLMIETIGLRWGLAVIGSFVTALALLGIGGLRRIDSVALAPEGLDLLRAVEMLALLPERVLEQLARRSTVVTVPSGSVVLDEGDEGDRYYVIDSGTVEVSIRGEFIRTLGPGATFGEIALLRDIPRTATITATSDLVARVIDREHFIPAVTGHGESADRANHVVGRLMMIC